MILPHQVLYNSNGFVGFDKSAQWTMFCKTCAFLLLFLLLIEIEVF